MLLLKQRKHPTAAEDTNSEATTATEVCMEWLQWWYQQDRCRPTTVRNFCKRTFQ